LPRKFVRRDAFEAECCTGDEGRDEVFGRIDAPVREAIQNSLNARRNGQKVLI
jgi:hypothetical protein